MADLEAVLADVSYLMAMEKSKCTPAARASKKIVLPDPRCVIFSIFIYLFIQVLKNFMITQKKTVIFVFFSLRFESD